MRNVTLSHLQKSTLDGRVSEALTLIYTVCSLALWSNGCDAQSYMRHLHLGDAGAKPTAGSFKMKSFFRWLDNYFWSSCAFKRGSVHCWVISMMQQGGKSGELKIIMSLLGIFELQRGVGVWGSGSVILFADHNKNFFHKGSLKCSRRSVKQPCGWLSTRHGGLFKRGNTFEICEVYLCDERASPSRLNAHNALLILASFNAYI